MIEVMGAQGSAQWVTARCGIPTASRFGQIITPAKLQASKSVGPYMHELLAEWIFGEPVEIEATPYMERGSELEDTARQAYTIQTGHEVREVGLCLTDESNIGCSPDGLIGEDGGLEIKIPGLIKHIGYMLDPGSLLDAYRLQVHGGLYVCKADWWDIMSYHPSLPDVVVHVDRDGEIIGKLNNAMCDFLEQFEAAKERLFAMGVSPDIRPFEARQQVVKVAA